MHVRLEELIEHLATQRAVLRAAVDRIAPAMRDEKPAPDRWSVAEVLEHLALIESRIAGLLSSAIASARDQGLRSENETTTVLDPAQMALLLDRNRRVETNESGIPSGRLSANDAWTALETSRRKLLDAVTQADGLALGDLFYPHPILGPLNLYQWIAFVGGHEARHAGQIDEIVARLMSNK